MLEKIAAPTCLVLAMASGVAAVAYFLCGNTSDAGQWTQWMLIWLLWADHERGKIRVTITRKPDVSGT